MFCVTPFTAFSSLSSAVLCVKRNTQLFSRKRAIMAVPEKISVSSTNTQEVKRNEAVLDHLRTRRSVSANALGEPGPDEDALADMLTVAARVPDHKKLTPWRFIVLRDDARAAFGDRLAEICAINEPEASSVRLETERTRFLRAPVVIAVISSPKPHPACPEWEQILSAGAVCLNLLHAAGAMGLGAQWITEWYGFDKRVEAAFGLVERERFAGFVYIGAARERPADRDRPDLAAIASFPDGPV